MLNAAIEIAFVLIGTALALNLYRLLRGPDTTDRILALDTLGINAIAPDRSVRDSHRQQRLL
jgi:multicomponent K+:H+ antiporter subunit F